jgi:valyl-tRNA synthetase
MIMMGIKFMDDVPFHEVYVHGLVRDSEGQKMSKSKGNVIDPLDIVDGIDLESLVRKRTTGLMQPHLAASIEKATRKAFPDGIPSSGTDALRFTFASLATQSRDIRFDLQRVAGYRNFCNKLWNATRFVLMTVEGDDATGAAASLPGEVELSMADRWIRSRLGHMLRNVETAFAEYRFDFAATALYEFTWYEFCDWYLELTKPVLQSTSASAAVSAAAQRAARRTLVETLESLLRALHPLMPFISEEIWTRVAPLALCATAAAQRPPALIVARWPAADAFPRDPQAEQDIAWIQRFVLGIRQVRGEMDISPARRLPVLLANADDVDRRCATEHAALLQRLAGLESLRLLAAGETEPPSALALAGELKLLVPMAGLIDPAAESERLNKRIARISTDLAKTQAKLNNANFVSNAPPDVVAQEQARTRDFELAIASLQQQLARVQALR